MRSVCLEKGAALAYTEVTQATALARRIPVILHSLSAREDERPLVGHVYGRDPDTMVEAARVIEESGIYCAIDVNCGCPVRKIVAKGAGVALMREPKLIGDIVARIVDAVALPVMVKTRLGLSPEEHNCEEVARRAEDSGAAAVAVHARYASAQHSGPADWEALGKIKDSLNIPVIGNGGVETPDDAEAMLAASGVDAVMIGRGAVGNPWIFEQIRATWQGRQWSPPSKAERMETIRLHLERLAEYIASQREVRRRFSNTAERTACLKFRGHLVHYLGGKRGVKNLMRKIDGIYTIDGLLSAVDGMLSSNS